MKVEELLASRTDLSTFLVHLTKSTQEKPAKAVLKEIISSRKLIASTAFGMAAKELEKEKIDTASQKVVCFTETPLEHMSLLTGDIEGRACKFEPYGIAITRKQGRKKGVNPIWYLDITPGHSWLTNPINDLIAEAIKSGEFPKSHIAKIAPFLEQMGASKGYAGAKTPSYMKEFWWEREWRHVGELPLPHIYMVLCPAEDIQEIREHVATIPEPHQPQVKFIDPRWSLELIIGKLAGFDSDDLGPF